ncbi:hypothetical protein CEE44_02725 [Candidatus Woesearchaeota archaeon B3_Woes]|nr:MAG: hypothetical protein CEE44_02725 [Candidatus Woesearchaeota archaeon B3_Woes]
MKKILLIMVLLFVVGCSQSEGPSATITNEDLYKGNIGLVANFGQNMPPVKVYENDIFPVGIELSNKGAFDIIEGYLLLNLEEDNMELEKGDIIKNLKLKGKSLGNPKGDMEIVSFFVKAKELGKETETITSNIIATSCYRYKTFFSKTVCVDTDFYNLKKAKKACSAQDMVFGSGQGSYVPIVRIEPNMMEDDGIIKPMFVIYIENKGQGEVTNPNSIKKICSDEQINPEDLNYIEVEAFLSETPLVCRPSPIKLQEREKVVRCVLEEGISKDVPSYSTILTVNLDYGYTDTISKRVEIRKII